MIGYLFAFGRSVNRDRFKTNNCIASFTEAAVNTPFYGCSCRAVGEVVVSLLTSRWVEEGCHQPGPKHVSAIPKDEAIQPGSVSLEVREER